MLQGEKPWAQSAYLKTFQIQFVFAFLYSKFGVFLAKVNGTGTKRIMNVIFFPLLLFAILLFLPLCVSLFKRESLL